jgi:FAD/FMN-containing dehydrogenase
VTISRGGFVSAAGAAFASIAAIPGRASAPPARTFVRGSRGYDAARRNENARLDLHPRAIVFCKDQNEVARAIRWANEGGGPIAIRSGGHDYEGFSLTDGGVVIDVGGLRGVEVSSDGTRARVGAGTDAGTMYHRLNEVGRTLPAGTCHSVALAGLTTGGGFGLIGRRHGLMADRLERVRLIDADGRLRDSAHDPDGEEILWASRGGGGGNFGVVTDLFFSLVEQPANVVLFSLEWDLAHAEDVLQRWMAWAPAQPRELVAICLLQNIPAQRARVIGEYLGSQAALEANLERAFARADALDFSVETMPFIAAVDRYAGYGAARTSWKMKSSYGAVPLGAAEIAAAAALVRRAPSEARCILQFDGFGGAVNDLAPGATAFPHRTMSYSLQYRTYWNDVHLAAPAYAWARDAFAVLDPHTAMKSYRNYCDLDLTDWRERYHGENYARLRRVKTLLDPSNRFRFPQGIEPA